jgi:hypothetical protein
VARDVRVGVASSIRRVGTYDIRAHPRVQVVIDGLRAHGVEVVECNPPLGLDTDARVAILKHPWRLPLLAWRRAVDLGDVVAAVAADAARFGWSTSARDASVPSIRGSRPLRARCTDRAGAVGA